jgi:hypothetical protein
MNDLAPSGLTPTLNGEQASELMAMLNAASRRIESLFPGYFPDAKHNHYLDFGYPSTVSFGMAYAMYSRNGLARAGVDKTILKTWENNPCLWETEDPEETPVEKEVRLRFQELRIWQRLAEADRRSLVGGYSGVIFRFRDSLALDQPVTRVNGGLEGLAGIIPCWASQLTVEEWEQDTSSENYGEPKMFLFNETPVDKDLPAGSSGSTRQVRVHPDRVMIWSADGTVYSRSLLEPGYNDLLTMEKISGSGGEGFWKNSKASPVLRVDKDAKIEDMARAMRVQPNQIQQAMNDQVADWQRGFDKLLMIQGMEAMVLPITLPQPQEFFDICLQCYAASINMPTKVLIGNQQGERASTEDSAEWNKANMARRENEVVPLFQFMIRKLVAVGILPEADWQTDWPDLAQTTQTEKVAIAKTLSDINAVSYNASGEITFTPDEIREAADYEPLAPEDYTPPASPNPPANPNPDPLAQP